MPIGKDTDRQGSGRIDRDTGETGETINVEPYWANMHRFFSQSGGPKPGEKGHEDWEAGKADIHRYMHTDQYTKQAADPDSDQHFPGHEQWKKDNPA